MRNALWTFAAILLIGSLVAAYPYYQDYSQMGRASNLTIAIYLTLGGVCSFLFFGWMAEVLMLLTGINHSLSVSTARNEEKEALRLEEEGEVLSVEAIFPDLGRRSSS